MPCLKGYRYPHEIIAYAVWAYRRFALSTADVEDLLAERGVIVSREVIRLWINHFGARSAQMAILLILLYKRAGMPKLKSDFFKDWLPGLANQGLSSPPFVTLRCNALSGNGQIAQLYQTHQNTSPGR